MIPVVIQHVSLDSDKAENPLLLQAGKSLPGKPRMLVARGVYDYRIYFWQVDPTDPKKQVTVRMNTDTVVLGAKIADFASDTPLVYGATGFIEGGDGTAGWYYAQRVSLDNSPMIAAALKAKGQMTTEVEITATSSSGQVEKLLYKQIVQRGVLTGGENPPPDVLPPYPEGPEALMLLGGNADGTDWKFYNFVEIATLLGVDTVSTPPANQGSTGTKGKRIYSNGYVYECIATNSWIRKPVVSTFTN